MVRSVRLWEDRSERGEAGRHGTADTMPAVRKEVETMTDENENMRRCLSCDHISYTVARIPLCGAGRTNCEHGIECQSGECYKLG